MPSLTTTAFRRARRLAAASIVAVAAFSLTACNSSAGGPGPAESAAVGASEGGSTGGSTGGSSGGSTGGSGSSGGDAGSADTGGSGSQASGGSTGGTSGGTGSTGSGTGKGTDTGTGTGPGTGTGRKGVDATLVGTLKYLAPGKLTVTPESGTEQAFFVAEDTKVLGAATLCGGPGGQVTITKDSYGTTPCTTDQLDEAAKKNTVKVRATIHRGIATKVEERYHP
ncbi:hypothetical protein [Streptomyces chrestomyceticus]|uniref:hypothetical protein n=1 Tax=Streptomyces chrestomyceticus TaxID=68185 RepID=UPI0019D191F5|nr:hypothetical protein [Streptomyces chrestomyceticus]